MNIFSRKKVDPEADAKLRALTEELHIKTQAFKYESRLRYDEIEDDIIDTRHSINVTKEDIREEVERGLRKINAAADAIVFPEDASEYDR
jgi:hypothetical protein